MKIATIISANYIAFARVLANSIAAVGYPRLVVLLVDRKTPELQALIHNQNFDCLFAEDLNINGFERLAFKYDVTELCTALKPTFLKYLLTKHTDLVVYLDPDIYVYQRLVLVEKQGKQLGKTHLHFCALIGLMLFQYVLLLHLNLCWP